MTQDRLIEELADAMFNGMEVSRSVAKCAAEIAIARLDALGCCVAPKEPNEDMILAGWAADDDIGNREDDAMRPIYRAMIQSAQR